jgi:hypothetical protein
VSPALLVLLAMAGPAQASSPFSVTAAADGIRTLESDPSLLPLGLTGDGGGPTAQVGVSTTGYSVGFAASPNPSAIAVGAPALVGNGVPGYPLAVRSSYPTNPTASQDVGADTLLATSSARMSQASGSSGGSASALRQDQASAHAEAAGSVAADSARADASATAEGIAFAGVLTISRVHSEAHVTRAAGRAPVRKASFAIGAATVAGLPVTIDESGVHAAGQAVALGTPVADILASAGVMLSVTPEKDTPTGVVAPSVQLSVSQTLPAGGTATTTYTFGFADAEIAAAAGTTPASPVATLAAPASHPTPATAAPSRHPATTSTTSAPASVLLADQALSGLLTTRSPPVAISPVTISPAAATQGTQLAQASTRGQVGGRVDALGLYLVVAGAALVMLATSQLVRIMGVRSAWT